MRFIHCADLHLDTPFSGLCDSRSAELRQAELRQTFLAIIELAKKADALLIAGDLFDQESLEPETVRLLVSGFASLGKTPVLIAAGNHDPLTENSYYRLASFSPNVHIFGTQPEKIRVGDCDVYGVSFKQGQQDEPIIENFLIERENPSVFLMHGYLGGADYNPVSREAVTSSGLSYLALGHVHGHVEEKIGSTLCVYPGCPEGRGFDEEGVKGVIEAEVTKEGVRASFVPVCRRRYKTVSVDVTGMVTQEEVVSALREKIESEQDLYKFVLTGETELVPRLPVLQEALAGCFFAKIYDRTKRPVDVVALANEVGIRGMFAQKILNEMAEKDERLCHKALELGLLAMAGEKVKLP